MCCSLPALPFLQCGSSCMKWASSSVYYLLGLWSRLVCSVPYLKGDTPSKLDEFMPKITEGFITSRFDSVQVLLQIFIFSILWPTQDVHQGDECFRDFLFGIGEDKQRSARLTAWFHTPENYFLKAYEKRIQNLKSTCITSSSVTMSEVPGISRTNGGPLRVYTDIPHVQDFLTRLEFSVNADIIWTSMQVDEETRKAVGITDEQYINQFPYEACIVMKHHLADTVQKAYGSPQWLQPTYDLEKHLAELIGDYYVRERAELTTYGY